jgi:hypothetical protein
VIHPFTSDVNFTPSSSAVLSALDGVAGVMPIPKIEQGHWTVVGSDLGGDWTLPLSSVARTRMGCDPVPLIEPVYDQEVVPVARCQLSPPSRDTSTIATMPPPVSLAVPFTVRTVPLVWVVPEAGEVIATVGAVLSVDMVGATSPAMSVPGCAFMSANTFTVACCMSRLTAGPEPPSCVASSPQDQRMVPAENTRAPLDARYIVMLWVAVPAPNWTPNAEVTWVSDRVVDDRSNSPAGRNPLSASVSHS